VNETSLPKLDEPGAGLPPVEWAVARFILIPWYLGTTTPQHAFAEMEQQAKTILQIARSLSPDKLSSRILVPRLPGLEDSSRYWSVAMTVQHLVIVNQQMMRVVISLSNGKVPRSIASTAAVKPSPDVVPDAILSEYEKQLESLLETFRTTDTERFPSAKYSHPWFGALSARDWLLFVALHQRVHIRQIKEIVRRLD